MLYNNNWMDIRSRMKRTYNMTIALCAAAALFLLCCIVIVNSIAYNGDNKAQKSYCERLFSNATNSLYDKRSIQRLAEALQYPKELHNEPSVRTYIDKKDNYIRLEFKVDNESFISFEHKVSADIFADCAFTLFVLIEPLERVEFFVTDGNRAIVEQYSRSWADYMSGGNVNKFADSLDVFEEFLQSKHNYPKSGAFILSRLSFGEEQSMRAFPMSDKENENCRRAIDDYAVKSASYDGNDIKNIENCYRIQHIDQYPNNCASEYYIYLVDDAPVMQNGISGQYSYITDNSYKSIAGMIK